MRNAEDILILENYANSNNRSQNSNHSQHTLENSFQQRRTQSQSQLQQRQKAASSYSLQRPKNQSSHGNTNLRKGSLNLSNRPIENVFDLLEDGVNPQLENEGAGLNSKKVSAISASNRMFEAEKKQEREQQICMRILQQQNEHDDKKKLRLVNRAIKSLSTHF